MSNTNTSMDNQAKVGVPSHEGNTKAVFPHQPNKSPNTNKDRFKNLWGKPYGKILALLIFVVVGGTIISSFAATSASNPIVLNASADTYVTVSAPDTKLNQEKDIWVVEVLIKHQ